MANIVIAAGGTAGHVVPALAVAAELRDSGATVSFLGAEGRLEGELVPAAGFELDQLRLAGIDRHDPVAAARAIGLAMRSLPGAREALRRRRADAVMGGGGFVAGPGGLAARTLGIPLVLTEADRHLGLANRLLARTARRVCLAFPIPSRRGDRYLVTGRPVGREVLESDRGAARRRFGIGADARCLLVMGGSQGARSLNEAAIEAFAERTGRGFDVIHVCGRRDHEPIRRRLAAAVNRDGYTLLAYEPDMGDSLAACDLVLGRSGGSIFELTALGRPAILVPYPHATADHQMANARWMESEGAATVIEDSELSAGVIAAEATSILADRDRLARMAAASARLARPQAARLIAEQVLAAAAGEAAAAGKASGP